MSTRKLPSLGMIFTEAVTEVLIPAGIETIFVFLIHVDFLGVLFEVCHIVSSVPPLKDRISSLGLLLTFPK